MLSSAILVPHEICNTKYKAFLKEVYEASEANSWLYPAENILPSGMQTIEICLFLAMIWLHPEGRISVAGLTGTLPRACDRVDFCGLSGVTYTHTLSLSNAHRTKGFFNPPKQLLIVFIISAQKSYLIKFL